MESCNRCTESRARLAQRSGYVLVYLIVLIALVATLGAMMAPALASASDEAKVVDTYALLAEIDTGIVTFGATVKTTNAAGSTVYPGGIHQLATEVTTSDQVSCQNAQMTAKAAATWAAAGPFVPMIIESTGLYTPMGVVNDMVEHPAKKDSMFIRIPNADTALVNRMDNLVDDGDGGSSGTIQYGAPAGDVVDMLYQIGYAPNFTLKAKC